jgi:hypothetical protein
MRILQRFGSVNTVKKGLALTNNFNYELATKIDNLDNESILYFKKILNESILVTDEIYEQFKTELSKLKPLEKITEPVIKDTRKDFLISSLPMSYSIEELFELYSNKFNHKSKERIECAMHDISLYNIPPKLNKTNFKKHLKEQFFNSKFIKKLLGMIDEEGMYFGRVKEWIQKNCHDVPVPSRRDLTGNIQTLYKWIVELSDGEYAVDRPNYSERIYKNGNK